MATFYVGSRPVLKGRSGTITNPAKNKVGVYSNWHLYNTSHVLDGGPDNNHVPGAGRHPGSIAMSRWFLGLQRGTVMDGAGSGPRLSYHRTKMHEYKGLAGAAAFGGTYGHAKRSTAYSVYNNFSFDGVASAEALNSSTTGHAVRAIGATGTANTFGRFDPNVNHGVMPQALSGASGTRPAAGAGVRTNYGHEHTTEWFGVPSAKAL